MYTPLQSLNIRGSAGEALKTVWPSLEAKGIRLIKGQLCLACAGPGTGKSAFVLNYALKAKVPTLYISADSDGFTQTSRGISILTGWSMERSATAVISGDLGEAAGVFDDIPIRFEYEASPTLDEVEELLEAYFEVYNVYPALVIVDNVTNVLAGDDDNPYAGLEALMEYLHKLARDTGACVIGLHHVTGGYNDANKPIPLSGVKGQIARVPEMVITMYRNSTGIGADTLHVSAVKNRAAKADPTGWDAAELEFVGDSMQIRDFAATTL